MSHLPNPVLEALTAFACAVDDGLQAEGYRVDRAARAAKPFQLGYVVGTMHRALLCSIALEVAMAQGIGFEELGNGGGIASVMHDGNEYRFWLKKGRRDARGYLDVRVSSESRLTFSAVNTNLSLFGDDHLTQQDTMWVLAYLVDPITRSFREAFAALPNGLVQGTTKPYRLSFATMVPISFDSLMPPGFDGHDEDLDLGDAQYEDDHREEGGAEEGA